MWERAGQWWKQAEPNSLVGRRKSVGSDFQGPVLSFSLDFLVKLNLTIQKLIPCVDQRRSEKVLNESELESFGVDIKAQETTLAIMAGMKEMKLQLKPAEEHKHFSVV